VTRLINSAILSRMNLGEPFHIPDWLLRLFPFLLFASVPIVWFRRFLNRAMISGESSDPAPIHYATVRFLSLASVALWLLWTGSVIVLQPWQTMAQVFHLGPVCQSALHNLLTLLAPSLILSLLDSMSYDVTCVLRELDIPRWQHYIDSLFGRIWLTLPFALVGTGIALLNTLRKPGLIAAMLFILGGFFALILLQFGWLRRKVKLQFTPHSVSFGPLRDRAFALAQVAGVKLNQIYVFPMSRCRLANAYASEEKNLLLTDWLLRHLSIREVDAVIGHELAHMKRGHAGVQGLIFILLIAGPLFWFQWQKRVPDFANVAFFFLLCWYSIILVTQAVSRRHERHADLEGIRISQDPEAFITGLTRLDRLNMTPLEMGNLDEKIATHPSTRKRIHAVATAANVPPETINQLLANSAEPQSSEKYELPPVVEAATSGADPVFNSTLKHQMVMRYTFLYMAGLGGLPVLLIYLLSRWPAPSTYWAGCLGAALLSIAFILLIQDSAVGKLQARLRPRLRTRLFPGNQAPPLDPVFVGLSPHSGPRLYEGCHNWDLGFLEIHPGFLRYTGEQCKFTLAPEQIRSIHLGEGPRKWLQTNRIYFQWSDPASPLAHFSLCSAVSRSLWGDSRRNRHLFSRLQNWLLQFSVTTPIREERVAAFDGLPPTAEVTSQCPHDFARPSQFLLSLGLIAFLAFMISSMTLGERSRLAPRFYAAAWAAALHVFSTLPVWCRRSTSR